ncbi:MAG: MBL fold metallo-hydrolase [Eubacterium ramulus]
MLSYQEIVPDIIAIKDGNVWMYLVKGRERAVLIDTGFGELSLETTVKALYDNHVIVCHTHTHHDHIGGDIFSLNYMLQKKKQM